MKILLTVLAMVCLAPELWAQTNGAHYAPKAADMRIVEGKMYNRVLSTNWTTLPTAGTTLTVLEIATNGVFMESHKGGIAGDKLLVKDYPDEKKLAKGQVLTKAFRVMEVADVPFENSTVKAYDCGLANTKANRKTLVNGPIHAAQ